MLVLYNVAICVWVVVMSQVTYVLESRRYFINLERYVTKLLDDLSQIYLKFLFCCSRTEHKSVIICCNVGRDSAIYLHVLDITCYRPSSSAIDGIRAV